MPKNKEPKLKTFAQGGPRTLGTEPDGVTNCKKCFGRGFVWRYGKGIQSAEPCTRCGGC